MGTNTPASSDSSHQKKRRQALVAAMGGFFVDMFDVYLPAVALAPAIVYFLPDHATGVEKATFTALVFAVSLVGRPLGSLIFGSLGDRIGRRRTTIMVAIGFTTCTGLIAVLPGYAVAGFIPAIALVVLRLLDGIFLGGEYTAANPLAMEYAPEHRRGLYGGLIHIGFPAALAAITIVTMLTLSVFESGGPADPYSVWGWRIPFVIGFLISLWVVIYYWRSVPESEIWTKMAKVDRPLATLFSRANARALGLAFIVGSGAWLVLNGNVGVFAGHFKNLDVSVSTINGIILTAAVPAALTFPFVGEAAQRYGRGRVIAVLGVLNVVVAAPMFGLAVANSAEANAMLWVSGALCLYVSLLIWSVITPFIIEMFPPQVRSSGYGIAYSFPSIIPAFFTYYMLWLGNVMSYDYTPIVFTVLGGALILIGALRSEDLRHVSMDENTEVSTQPQRRPVA